MIETSSAEPMLRYLVDAVSDYAIYMLDADGRVASWNTGARRLKGYAEAEIRGRHFAEFFSLEDRANGVPDTILSSAAQQGRIEVEGWGVRKDGTRFWALGALHAIRDEQGVLLGFANVTRDMTDRRRAELELQRAHEQLAQSQKLEALGKLTGGVAHDFNNLLMVISGQAQLLRRKVGDDPRALRALEAIEMSARRGEDLTRGLLSFSRRQRLTPSSTSLSDRAGGLREMLSASLPPAVRLDMALADSLWPVAVDVGEFELALLNLAVNARDAMPGGGALSLSGENVTLDGAGPGKLVGDFVGLTLRDTGTGIAPDILPKVFDPFFTTKDVDLGAGLGLSQVFGFAQQSGGHIGVHSELGAGTAFTLYLPRAKRPPRAEVEGEPLPPASSARILLVEDNPEVAEVAARMLEELGHEVRLVGNAAAALAALSAGDLPDLIFSDIVMAGEFDGLGMARRAREAFPGVPILLATGYSEAAARIGDEFPILRKPYKLAGLNRAIAERLASVREDGKLVDLEAARRARDAGAK
ncbi:MAG TPA: ATP-binding protein [Phenylobacterium sp.]